MWIGIRKMLRAGEARVRPAIRRITGKPPKFRAITAETLPDFVRDVDRAGGPATATAAALLQSHEYRPSRAVAKSLDPFSDEYVQAQVSLYEEISGRKLDQTKNERTVFDLESHLAAPNPYAHKFPGKLAVHYSRLAEAFRHSKVPIGGHLLDMGCGWGLSSEFASTLGLRVTAVDINPDFVALVRGRARRAGLPIEAVEATFEDFESDELYDMVLFYECLHHAVRPWKVIESLAPKVAVGGEIVLAGEPINGRWWDHWGIRLDGLSVYCIRKFGWFESGWTADFIATCFRENGFEPSVRLSQDREIGYTIHAEKHFRGGGKTRGERITVLIPTCRRADVLRQTLETCRRQPEISAEVVFLVSDNGSDPHTGAVVEEFASADRRFQLIRPPRELSMADHWEFAIGNVRSGWLMIIGDDDALMPTAVATLEQTILRYPDASAINWPYSFYLYPNASRSRPGRLVGIGLEAEDEIRDGMTWVRRLADFRSAYYKDLPMVYHGLVHTSLLAKVRQTAGKAVVTDIPDVALAVSTAAVCRCYVRLRQSQSLFGASRHSTGLSSQGDGDEGVYREFIGQSKRHAASGGSRLQSIASMILDALVAAKQHGLISLDCEIDTKSAIERILLELWRIPNAWDSVAFTEVAGLFGEEERCEELLQYGEHQRAHLAEKFAGTRYDPSHAYIGSFGDGDDAEPGDGLLDAVSYISSWYAANGRRID
jgi:2-polyprenyl-3-methyl-5-hydroxy-6-metoxy-1,4-benzoquinol methylase